MKIETFFYHSLLTVAILIYPTTSLFGQFKTENGHNLPVNDTIRVLLVFAENHSTATTGAWLPGELPPNKDDWFDSQVTGNFPSAFITRYYYEASFGQYVVLGDYYKDLVTVSATSSAAANKQVIDFLDSQSSITTNDNSLSLSDFDMWGNQGIGVAKSKTGNNIIDCFIIIWRKANFYGGCSSGGGVGNSWSDSLKTFKLRVGSAFNACKDGNALGTTGAQSFVLVEYFHGMFGGNEWHTVGGASNHTFVTLPHTFGLTSQAGSQSRVINGWERNHLGWKGWQDDGLTSPKTYLISALNTSGNEVLADIQIPGTQIVQEFILRDFVITGDMVRIKFPHINWATDGDVKNQYLWLENHQKKSEFDRAAVENSGCGAWTPGIIAYIQVGKDSTESPVQTGLWPGESSLPSTWQKPNALGSYLYPLTAEGNWDFNYRNDLSVSASAAGQNQVCVFGNNTTPIDYNGSIPNPFIGFSELFNAYNYDGNDSLHSPGDTFPPGLSEVIAGQVVYNRHESGDAEDAFINSEGRNKLSIGTNPAAIPVYTFTSGRLFNEGWGNYDPNQPRSYENRTIWLNGLSIEIVDETFNSTLGANDIKIRIKWNERNIPRMKGC